MRRKIHTRANRGWVVLNHRRYPLLGTFSKTKKGAIAKRCGKKRNWNTLRLFGKNKVVRIDLNKGFDKEGK